MDREELIVRRLTNQYLLRPAPKDEVVRGLCGMQAQFLPNVRHSLKIRSSDYDPDTFPDGLVRNWTIRRTMHVFLAEDLPLFLHCKNGADYRSHDWSGRTFWNRRDCWALTPERQAYLARTILDALASGPRTRDELKEVCRAAGMTQPEEDSMFDQWGGGIRELCERGFMNAVVSEQKAYCLSPDFTPIPEEEAELVLAERYFTNFGPASVHDAMYFFHTTAAKVKRWLTRLPVKSCICGENALYYLDGGRESGGSAPDCLFLAGFDQFMLGYEKKESVCLRQENLRQIFNLAGIVMPAVLLYGEAAGRWKQKNGKLTVELFRAATARERESIEEKARALWPGLSKLEVVLL